MNYDLCTCASCKKLRASGTWELSDGVMIQLLTPKEYEDLPYGTPLIDINGECLIKGNDTDEDQDTRFGFLAFGVDFGGVQ